MGGYIGLAVTMEALRMALPIICLILVVTSLPSLPSLTLPALPSLPSILHQYPGYDTLSNTTKMTRYLNGMPRLSLNSYSFSSLLDSFPYPRSFHVPGTDTVIDLSLGMPVNWRALLGLLLVSQNVVFEELEHYSENTGLPIVPLQGGGYGQNFEYTLFDGVNITVTNKNAKVITLGNMRDLLHSLWVYLASGYRSRECALEFSSGPGGIVGKGTIVKDLTDKAGMTA